jgi:ABC-2 type transport system ATP-binding protein
VSVNGHRYAASPAPLREIGALLDAHAIHPGRSARDHLRWLAASNGIPTTRVGEVLDLVGLESVAGQRAGRFSLGMGQRLGIAAAMLGDPPVVVLDEPVNGLDPEGIRWVRTFARQLADEGRTVFISSHLMSEMALMADHLLVIGRGTILADCSMTEFMTDHAASYVRVKAPALGDAANLLTGRGLDVTRVDDELRVGGMDAPSVGELMFRHGLMVHELTLVRSSLEDAFMTLTADSVEYHASTEGAVA